MTNRLLILAALLAASAAAVTTLDGFVGKFTYFKVPAMKGYLTNPFTYPFHAIEEQVQERWGANFNVWWNVTGRWTPGPYLQHCPWLFGVSLASRRDAGLVRIPGGFGGLQH
jgi:hypothetical protein